MQLEPINPIQVEHPAMMPMLGSMSQSRRKRAKQPARLERTSLSKGNHPAMTQMQGTMWMKLQEQPKQPVMPAPSIRTRALQVPVLVLTPIQGILCQRKAKQTRPLVLLEPISPIRVEHFVMMLTLDTTSQTRRKRAKQPARSERTSLSKGNHPAMTQMQGTMWMKLLQQARTHVP